jgi:hypothetical protein
VSGFKLPGANAPEGTVAPGSLPDDDSGMGLPAELAQEFEDELTAHQEAVGERR